MQSFVTLRKTGFCWEFESEEALEDFLFTHLDQILGWRVIERQYIVQGQRCDLLAIDETGRLIVIELKNVEDRGIVQQLTRYYHVLQEERPFRNRIDYEKPVNLVGITPSFHRDNFIDRQYHRLDFEFFQFSIVQEEQAFYLILKDVDTERTSKLKICYQQAIESEVPSPPQKLMKFINDFEVSQKETILRIREKILSFDPQIQEVLSGGSIKYGNGTAKSSKYCAELILEPKYSLVLFLWIPFKCGESNRIGRARIWTDWHEKALIEGYIGRGLGTEINKQKRIARSLIEAITFGQEGELTYYDYVINNDQRYRINLEITEKMRRQYTKLLNTLPRDLEKNKMIIQENIELFEIEMKLLKERYNVDKGFEKSPYRNLDSLIDLALEKWIERV